MIKAIIFDMDGVISDTQIYHAQAESILLKRFGVSMKPEEITTLYAGVSDEQMFKKIFQKNSIPLDNITQLINKKWEIMKELLRGIVYPVPNVINLINELSQNGFALAIASSSSREFIEYVLSELKLREKFNIIVSGEEVIYGKPSPDIFLLAIKKLSVKIDEVLVIEDGISGMMGAKKAHISCIGLVPNISKKYPTDLQVTSLDQITLTMIQKI